LIADDDDCETALRPCSHLSTTLRASKAASAADNPVDDQLVIDLETMVERTKDEIERLSPHLARPS